jgi:hypothetical protein
VPVRAEVSLDPSKLMAELKRPDISDEVMAQLQYDS